MGDAKEWMLGLPGHTNVVTLDDVVLLVKGGQLRPTDLVKRLGQPWRAANEVPELADYFTDPSKPSPPPPLRVAKSSAPSERPKTTRNIPKAEAPKPTSRRIAKPDLQTRKPAPTTRKLPSASRPPEETTAASQTRSSGTDPGAPAVEEKSATAADNKAAAETKSPADTRPASETKPPVTDRKTTKIPPKGTRAIPKAPPKVVPRLDPMVGKYYSPVDLLRSASFSFDPKKLLLAAVMLIPLMVVAWLAVHFSARQAEGTIAGPVLFLFAVVVVILGLMFVLVALAYVTRRQLEGESYSISDVVTYTGSNVLTAVVTPMLVMIPSLLAIGMLWLLGLVRDGGSTAATILKILYIIPMVLSFLAVIGVLLYQLACMYVPAAAAIEGLGLTGAVNYAWNFIRRQWGRVVLHWLIITVAFGVIAAVGLGLAWLAMRLPEEVFGLPTTLSVQQAWGGFEGIMVIYRGLAYGLGLALSMSMLSTLGTLSYVSLRHPGSEQLSVPTLEETSGIPIQGPRATTVPPPEATHPAETRPAPADYSGEDSKPSTPAVPAQTPEPPPITDDSDEQPVVKD